MQLFMIANTITVIASLTVVEILQQTAPVVMNVICCMKTLGQILSQICFTISKLQEKDDQLKNIQNQFTAMQSQVQALISTLGGMDQSNKNEVAKRLFQNGVFKPVIGT